MEKVDKIVPQQYIVTRDVPMPVFADVLTLLNIGTGQWF